MKDRWKKLSLPFLVLKEGFWNLNKICKIYFVAQNARKDNPDNQLRKGRSRTIENLKKSWFGFFELFTEYKILAYIESARLKQADMR